MQFQPMVILPNEKYKRRYLITLVGTAVIAVVLCGVTISLPISLSCFGKECDCTKPHNKTATSLTSFFHLGHSGPKTTTLPPGIFFSTTLRQVALLDSS